MPRLSIPLAAVAFTVLLAGLPAAADDDVVVVGDVIAQSAIVKKPRRIIDKPSADEKAEDKDEKDKVDAPKNGDTPSRTVPGVTPKPTPKKPGLEVPKKPGVDLGDVKRPITKQPRQPREVDRSPPIRDERPSVRRPRAPTSPDEPRRTVRRPRTNPQPAPDQPPPNPGGGGGGGGGDGGGGGGCCCCSPKVTGMAVGGGILGGVTGLVVGGVVGAGVGYVVAPSGAPPEPVSETDRQIAMGVGALIGGVSGLLIGGVAGVGAGAALGGMLSE